MVAKALQGFKEASPEAQEQAEAAAPSDIPSPAKLPPPASGGPQLHVGLRPEVPDAAQPASEV